MSRAHCICPDFLSNNISNPTTFQNVFVSKLLTSCDQIILDEGGRIVYEYMESVKNDLDAFIFFKAWKKLLDEEQSKQSGKVLLTNITHKDNYLDVIYDSICCAVTTFDKCIIANDNNTYSPYLTELTRQRISLWNMQQLTNLELGARDMKRTSYNELDNDLGWILQRLVRKSKREKTEDEYNDFIRDMLDCKNYEVKDQTREGVSSSGKSAGELDIVIEQNGDLFSILEPMILTSVDTAYIDIHYRKLLHNYNPLTVQRTFLITYFEGKNFEAWWERYQSHIDSLSSGNLIPESEIVFNNIEPVPTKYIGIKKMNHHMNIGDNHFSCIHYAVKL